MNLQVSDEEAREEIFRRAHYYVHLARRTEYEQSTGLEVIKHLRAAIDPAPDMTPQLVLKTMIMQCDATLGRFPYPWSVDEKDAGARRVSFDMADKETAREIEEMKDIDVKIRSDKRMNWSMIRHEVESFGATPSPTAPKPSPPKLTLKLRGRKDGRDTVLAEADDAIPSIESPALRKHEKRKGKHFVYNTLNGSHHEHE